MLKLGRVARALILTTTTLLAAFGAVRAEAATVTVTTTAATGAGSLKEAIGFANANPGTTIAFAVPSTDPGRDSSGAYVFASPLLSLSAATTIDGTTQTALENSNPDGREIDIQNIGVVSAAVTVRGLTLSRREALTIQQSGTLTLAHGSSLNAYGFDSSESLIAGKLVLDASSPAFFKDLKLVGTLDVRGSAKIISLETSAETKFLGTGAITISGGLLKGELNLPSTAMPLFDFKGFTLLGTLRVPAGGEIALAYPAFTDIPFYIAGGSLINHGTVRMKHSNPDLITPYNSYTIIHFSSPVTTGEPVPGPGLIVNNGLWEMGPALQIISQRAADGRDTFTNNGILERAAGGRCQIICGFDNTGTVNLRGGYLAIFGDGTHSGTLNAATGSIIHLGDTATFRDGTRLLGDIQVADCRLEGRITVSGRTTLSRNITSLSTARLIGSGQVEFEGTLLGTLTLRGADAPAFQWGDGVLRGVLNIPAGATVNIWGGLPVRDGVTTRGVQGGTINNSGTISLEGGEKAFVLGHYTEPPAARSTINNNGLFAVDEGAFLSNGSDGARFNNVGRLEKRGSGLAHAYVTLNSPGVIEAREGSFYVGTTGVVAGLVKSSPDGIVSVFPLSGGPGILRSGARTEGRVHLGYTRLEGTVNVTGTCLIADRPRMSDLDPPPVDTLVATPSGRFIGTGTVRWVRGGLSGTLNLGTTGAARFQWEGGTLKGVLNVPKGGQLFLTPFQTAPELPEPPVSPVPKSIVGGSLRNQGLVHIQANTGVNTMDNLAAYIQTAGETLLEGTVNGSLRVNGGVLSGTGTVNNDLFNLGAVVAPGGDSVGTLRVHGGYTQDSAGRLRLNVNGRSAGQFDVLDISGAAVLNGVQQTVFADGFTLAESDRLRVLNYASRSGLFNALTAQTAILYEPDHAVLTRDAVAPTATITTPPSRAVVSSLSVISGSVADNASGIRKVTLYLRRVADLKYWTGSQWVDGLAEVPTFVATATNGTQSWRVTTLLPKDTNLVDGDYYLVAFATDRADNQGPRVSSTFTLRRTALREVGQEGKSSPEASNVDLSAITARQDGTVVLLFTGPLHRSALEVARYSLQQNGEAVAVMGIRQHRAGEITLSAAELVAGARLIVTYQLEDDRQRTVSGTAVVTVR